MVQRPHEFPGSATPVMAFRDKAVQLITKSAKDVPDNIVVKRFEKTKVTAYGLKKAV